MRKQIKLCLRVADDAAFDLLCAGCMQPLQEGRQHVQRTLVIVLLQMNT